MKIKKNLLVWSLSPMIFGCGTDRNAAPALPEAREESAAPAPEVKNSGTQSAPPEDGSADGDSNAADARPSPKPAAKGKSKRDGRDRGNLAPVDEKVASEVTQAEP